MSIKAERRDGADLQANRTRAPRRLARLSRPCRAWIFLAIFVYFAVLAIGSFRASRVATWRILGVPATSPAFLDLHTVTAAIECYGLQPNVDIYRSACVASRGQKFNYPRVWLLLSTLPIKESDTTLIGIAAACLFYAVVLCIANPRTWTDVAVWITALCSPSLMLLTERGNTDELIFCLLAVGPLIHRRAPRASVVLQSVGTAVSTMLKLYPVAGVVMLAAFARRRAVVWALIGGVAFTVYICSTWRDLASIVSFTPTPAIASYGARVVPRTIALLSRPDELAKVSHKVENKFSQEVLSILVNRTPFRRELGGGWALHGLETLAVLCAVIGSAVTVARTVRAPDFRKPIGHATAQELQLFWIGSSIYLATFLVLVSFDYRLVFLLFTLPALTRWSVDASGAVRSSARMATGVVVLTLWVSRVPFYLTLYADEVLNWALYFYLLWLLIRSFAGCPLLASPAAAGRASPRTEIK